MGRVKHLYEVEGDNSIELTWSWERSIYLFKLGQTWCSSVKWHSRSTFNTVQIIQAHWPKLDLTHCNINSGQSKCLRDCSLFIGSTGPVFCGKDPRKKFLSRQQKFPKKLVSRQWKEGKKVHVPYNYIIYSHCIGGATCNDQRSLPLTTGGLGGAVSPSAGPGPLVGVQGQSPWKLFSPAFYRIRKSLKLILYFQKWLWNCEPYRQTNI